MDKALIPFSRRALGIIAGHGLMLNALWEVAQAGPLYGMWAEVSVAAGLFHITMAIIGDVFLVLAISILAGWICGTSNVLALGWQTIVCMCTIGLVTGLVLEWSAKALNWWTYSEFMPTITLFGETLGWSPLLQITLLPLASVVLTIKFGNPLR